ncbi:MAG TPA: hypothetical protein VE172_22155 [Stackebrandtia sp.]|jgi:hypothetical protein|uniref:hypothetical protein n=1 Tax=Stackebrandtia sp. TaxID=2023065 RepID=UPI002D630B65|nr:hypothetical protein [Stackebrandtia sp.]HZE41513.1 hypothetical protein [Stackebrandtia sp.]
MTDEGPWHVLIFEHTQRGRLLSQQIHVGDDRTAAREKAMSLALGYEPTRPVWIKSRDVFMASVDSWVIQVHGATVSSDFEVQVARLIAQRDR